MFPPGALATHLFAFSVYEYGASQLLDRVVGAVAAVL